MSSIYFNNGIQKPRGLENAELQHLKHRSQVDQTVPAQTIEPITDDISSLDPYFVAKVEIGSSQPASKITYSPPFNQIIESPDDKGEDTVIADNGSKVTLNGEAAVDNGHDIVLAGNGTTINLNSTVKVDNSNDLMIIGNGVKLSWNSTDGIDNGNDTVIIGNGAKVEFFDSITGVDNSDDTLIIGNGAKVKISSVTGTSNGSGTIIIGEGADVEITGGLSVDSSKGGITYLDGKVRIHLVDQMNQSFQMEVNVKDKEEALAFQGLLRNKLKNNKLNFGDFLNSIREVQDHIKALRVKKNENIETPHLKTQVDLKLINKQQYRLAMMQSLVHNFIQSKFHTNQGLHLGQGLGRNINRIA